MQSQTKTRPKIILVGHSPKAQGGMAACIQTYLDSELGRRFQYLPVFTRTEGSKFLKARMLVQATVQFVWLSLFSEVRVSHIQFASDLSFWRKSWFVVLGKILNQRIIFQACGGGFYDFYQKRGSLARWYILKILNSVDLLVTASRFAQMNLTKICGRQDIRVVYNSIPASQLNNQKDKIHPEPAKLNQAKVLFLGRIEEAKGVYELIRAVSLIRQKIPTAKFYLGGTGEIDQARALCRELNLNGEIEFLGWIDGERKTELLRQATLFVLPTHFEIGPCVAILEAMSAGLPVVSCDVSGISEAIEDSVNGFLVPKGDYELLASRILELLQNRDLRERMRLNTLQKFRSQFDIKIMENELGACYEALG